MSIAMDYFDYDLEYKYDFYKCKISHKKKLLNNFPVKICVLFWLQ